MSGPKKTLKRNSRAGLTAASQYASTLRSTWAGRVVAALEGDRTALQQVAGLTAKALSVASGAEPADTELAAGSWNDPEDIAEALGMLGEAMARIAAGEEPNRVLGWKRAARGRPPRYKVDADRLAQDDGLISDIERLIERNGLTVEAACDEVAAHWKDDHQRLLNLYKRR